ncbi:alcohol oxidase [Wilcoxina mikolae CBS 423.85]|nr:alcohol oxidase [Wilcoxina mikolae CBS 423.85]
MTSHTNPALPADFTPDVIIAGGGTAACVLAGRLARSTPSTSILLIEAGSNNHNDPGVIRPGSYLHQQLSPRVKNHSSIPAQSLCGRSVIIPAGSGLGGGSSVNFLMYTRASASDFDDWNMSGWSAEELVPYLKKLETCHYVDGETHGKDGPVNVSFGGFTEEMVVRDASEAVREMGYEVVKDANDLHTGCAFQRWASYIDPVTGKRQDTAHRYVHPVLEEGLGTLHVLCNSTVVRVITEEGTAVGVEYVPSCETPFSTDPPPEAVTIRAKKLVIVSAGALGSPCILERSGIGNPTVLAAAGVEPIVSLPAVGTNYQDHNLIVPAFQVSDEVDTHDSFMLLDPEVIATAETEFKTGKGKFATNFIDFTGKIRPKPHELPAMGEEFKNLWDLYYKNVPDKPVVLAALLNCLLADPTLFPPGKFLTAGIYTAYPASRGTIHISSPSPYSHPILDPSFFSHPADAPTLVWGYKVAREICRRMKCVIGEVAELHPAFHPDSQARCEAVLSEEMKKREVVYTKEDDKDIEVWVRNTVKTAWHSLGTCAMGRVVDERLQVYGVEKLMVADLSVAPENVGANTNNTAIMIGEKAAVLAAEFLGVEV